MNKQKLEFIKIGLLASIILGTYLTLFIFIPILIWGLGPHLIATGLLAPLCLTLLTMLTILGSVFIYKEYIEDSFIDKIVTEKIQSKYKEWNGKY